jgi:hypothetical protein
MAGRPRWDSRPETLELSAVHRDESADQEVNPKTDGGATRIPNTLRSVR